MPKTNYFDDVDLDQPENAELGKRALQDVATITREMMQHFAASGVPDFIIFGGMSLAICSVAEALAYDPEQLKARLAGDVDAVYHLASMSRTAQ